MNCNVSRGTNNIMGREILKEKFKKILDNGILKCEITIDEIPTIIGIYKNEYNDTIHFYIEGDCVVEYDDIPTHTLKEIFNKLIK